MTPKNQAYYLLFFGMVTILFTGNCVAGVCLATQSGIGEARVRAVRNHTQLSIQVPYFYNGCEGNDVTLVAGLLDIHQHGSVSLSERIQIGHDLGANRVYLKLQVPARPFDGESHKIVIVMTAQEEGNSARLISQKRIEYRPRHRGRSNQPDDSRDRRNRTDGKGYRTNNPNHAQTSQFKQPDLCILNVRQFPPNVVPKPNKVFFEILVGNKGQSPCRGAIRVSGPDGVWSTIPPLGPRQSQTIRLPLNFRASGPGRTTIGSIYFQVDPDNCISESNETNNSAGPFTVIMN